MNKKGILFFALLLFAFLFFSIPTAFGQDVTNGISSVSNETVEIAENVENFSVIGQISLILFFVLFPAFVLFLETKIKIVQKIGGLLICYAAGILLGNLGILPKSAAGIQDLMTTLSIPIAIPLVFFSMNIKRWFRLAKKSILALVGQILAVSIVAFSGYFIFRNMVGAEAWKMSGMYVGVYTGGTVNLASIQSALHLDSSSYIALHTSDIIVSTIYLLFFMTVGQKIYLKFLPPFQPDKTEQSKDEEELYNSFKGMLKKENIKGLLASLLLALLIFAVGGGISMLFSTDFQSVIAILAITTLAIIASFLPSVRKIKYTYQFGQYFILIFCVVVGTMSDLRMVLSSAPQILLYTAYVVVGSMILHILFARMFKIDADTVIITSTAGINSPPMVPMIAAALKNKEIIVTGILSGIIGWMIGNYLGIAMSYLIKWISGS